MILVIMAAGMGSRFGGLKQIEPVNEYGEFIIDYSIFDAIRCGFDKVVFIIKKENYEVFRNTIGKRVENYIKVEYAFQNNDILPKEVRDVRQKPIGTVHAILCAKDKINSNFVVINADDFYGHDAFLTISEFLKNNTEDNLFSAVAYNVKKTITENGSVKRGVIEVKDGYLNKIIESKIINENNKFVAYPLDGSNSFEISNDRLAVMNFFGFTTKLFDYLSIELDSFLKNKDLYNDELILTDVISKYLETNSIRMKVLDTTANWLGMTYKEDKELLIEELKKLSDNNEYPGKLWECIIVNDVRQKN